MPEKQICTHPKLGPKTLQIGCDFFDGVYGYKTECMASSFVECKYKRVEKQEAKNEE